MHARRLVLPMGASLVSLLLGCSSSESPSPGPVAVRPSSAAPASGSGPSGPGGIFGGAAPSRSPALGDTCTGGASGQAWPEQVPAELPVPPTAQIGDVQERDDGLTVIKFDTTTSLRQSITFVLGSLPRAGYVLGRGDAEATEADAPFSNDKHYGVLRMVAVDDCRTTWLLAIAEIVANGRGAVLPTYTATSVPSPLPFG